MPESSANAGSCAALAAASAFSSALAMKVSPVSSGSGRPSSPAEIARTLKGAIRSPISRTLPWLWLAMSSVSPVKRRGMILLPHRLALQDHQFRHALLGELQHRREFGFRE